MSYPFLIYLVLIALSIFNFGPAFGTASKVTASNRRVAETALELQAAADKLVPAVPTACALEKPDTKKGSFRPTKEKTGSEPPSDSCKEEYVELARRHKNTPGFTQGRSVDNYGHMLGVMLRESDGESTNLTYFQDYSTVRLVKPKDTKREDGNIKDTLTAFKEMKTYIDAQAKVPKSVIKPVGASEIERTDAKEGSTKPPVFDHQLNAGLLQMSADRMKSNNGHQGEKNTVAQKNEDAWNKLYELAKTEPKKENLKKVIQDCGADIFFEPDYLKKPATSTLTPLEIEFSELAQDPNYKKAGNDTPNEIGCFLKWAIICPAWNLDLALNAPAAYFEGGDAPNYCQEQLQGI